MQNKNKLSVYFFLASIPVFFIVINSDNFRSVSGQTFTDFSGTWSSDDKGTYYLRQIGNEIWWFGKSNGHPIDYSNVFHGILIDNTIIGNWIDVPMGDSSSSGTLKLILQIDGTLHKVSVISPAGSYPSSIWTKTK
jgi:hypothetical protein